MLNKFFVIFFFNLLLIANINLKANVIINDEIAKKYNDIFPKKILSDQDVYIYKKIFIYQENCEWKIANKYILKIDNKILMGHVLAQRYLHPKCYKSQYIELYSWLKKYSDYPQAKRIYRLAIKRMPKGYKSPEKPSKVIGFKTTIINQNKNNKYKSKKKLSKNQKIEKRKLINAIKSRVNRGWPSGAVKLLNQRDVNILLDQVEIDQQKELISKGYFLADKNELAIKYGTEALEKSFLYVPYAGWTSGLAAWRLQDYSLAAKFFTNFSISLEDDEWHQASGSFWAARSFAKLNNYEEINFWLYKASKNPNSFYGIISSYILGINNPIDWNYSSIEIKDKEKIISMPASKRIKALIQIGLLNNVEKEIIKINSTLNKDVAMWSLSIAQNFNLAYTQLKIVNLLQINGIELPIKYHYPTPIWKPKEGFEIDPSLIYAFMHQESMFNSNAKSSRGAMGLMQIMPATAKFISSNKAVKRNNANILKNPEINIEVGQEYIQYLLNLDPIKNNLIYLAAAYNGGPGNLQKWQKNTNYLEDPLLFMESIPSRETRWFIEKVLTKYWIYDNKNGKNSNSLRTIANGKNPIY